jgi:GNAT superfamily N-acetyltransferase
VYLRDGEFIVGAVNDSVVAMGALRRTCDERVELKRLRVHPDYQGKGYGRQLFLFLEQRARELGFRVIHLDTTDRQTVAYRMYINSGYTEVRRRLWQGMMLIFLEKRL